MPKIPLRRFRFSILGLLVLTFVAAYAASILLDLAGDSRSPVDIVLKPEPFRDYSLNDDGAIQLTHEMFDKLTEQRRALIQRRLTEGGKPEPVLLGKSPLPHDPHDGG